MLSGIGLSWALEEVSRPTFMSEWGSLVGVVVGVLLGGAMQMIASIGQSARERRRDNRERRHDAYVSFLHALNEAQIALVLLDGALQHGSSAEEAMDYFERYVRASNELHVARTLIRIHGSRSVLEIAEDISSELWAMKVGDIAGKTDTILASLNALESDFISATREDLGVR